MIIDSTSGGSYIPVCTRNVFLKYYTERGAQQIHFWGPSDREAYLDAMLEALQPYLLEDMPENDSARGRSRSCSRSRHGVKGYPTSVRDMFGAQADGDPARRPASRSR